MGILKSNAKNRYINLKFSTDISNLFHKHLHKSNLKIRFILIPYKVPYSKNHISHKYTGDILRNTHLRNEI